MNPIHPMQTGTGFKPNKKTFKKRVNPMKKSRVVDYLDSNFLTRITKHQGKILTRNIPGLNAKQQREMAKAIKYARHLALIPFVANDLS